MLKKIIKNILPPFVLLFYHFLLAWFGAWWYKHPSDELFVIGITGTTGKSSTVYILRQLLEQAGYRVGALSTIEFYVNGEAQLNNRKMTMLGRMQLQKFLRRMVNEKCDVAIIETTSQAVLQHRHRFINYDVMMLTNLYPEHIEAHGGFENYKRAKIALFKHLAQCKEKNWRGTKFPKTAVLNAESVDATDFASAAADVRRFWFGGAGARIPAQFESEKVLHFKNVETSSVGAKFDVEGNLFQSPLYGVYTIMNITSALTIARVLEIDWQALQAGVVKLKQIPGRLEFINEGQSFKVIVDFAFEPVAMNALYETILLFKPKRIIHVLGSTGGGRDVARRFTVGELVGKKADYIFVTNEDPYNTPPQEIMRDVTSAVVKTGKIEDKNVWQILDRREALAHAFRLAEEGDLVLITGKGCEQTMCVEGDKTIPWDDRVVAREELKKIKL